jgi:transposase-like protein
MATPRKKIENYLKRGAPEKYDPAYCQEAIAFMEQGYSKTALAGHLDVCRETLVNWSAEHPEFLAALKTAVCKRVQCLEREMMATDVAPRVTARIFALKNADPEEWNKKEPEGEQGHVINLTINRLG